VGDDPPGQGATWVFHRGGLGDGVLLWPMLRALAAAGPVTLVGGPANVALAALVLGVDGHDVDEPRFALLWRREGGSAPNPGVVCGVRAVLGFLGPRPDTRDCWVRNAAGMFPGAQVRTEDARVDSRFARRWSDPAAGGVVVPLAGEPSGPIVLHVGSGGDRKRWPLDRWAALARTLGAGGTGRSVEVVAGEVEAARFDARERRLLADLGGRILDDAGELVRGIRAGAAFVGADAGPTHLAAQLGVPTVALFGPTDPRQWAPIGPVVRVVAPPAQMSMNWLDEGTVHDAVRRLLDDAAAVRRRLSVEP
jgi:hypothetical protein